MLHDDVVCPLTYVCPSVNGFIYAFICYRACFSSNLRIDWLL